MAMADDEEAGAREGRPPAKKPGTGSLKGTGPLKKPGAPGAKKGTGPVKKGTGSLKGGAGKQEPAYVRAAIWWVKFRAGKNPPKTFDEINLRPLIAVLWSCLFPGLGQAYNGQWIRAVVYLMVLGLNIALIFLLIGVLTGPLWYGFMIFEASWVAKRKAPVTLGDLKAGGFEAVMATAFRNTEMSNQQRIEAARGKR